MKTITLLLVDDHTLIRETWSLILSSHPQIRVVGSAGSAEQGIEMSKSLCPDVVIMDINLPGMNGIEATEIICKASPATKVLGVSLHTQPTYAKLMMRVGASGYVTKNSSREEMFIAIIKVSNGNRYICQEIKNIIAEPILDIDSEKEGINGLTTRELEIITYLQKGLSSKEVADALAISVKTVEVHRYNILKKLKLNNTAALIDFIHTNRMELLTSLN